MTKHNRVSVVSVTLTKFPAHRNPQHRPVIARGATLALLGILLSLAACAWRTWTFSTPDFQTHYRTRSVTPIFHSSTVLEIAPVTTASPGVSAMAVATVLPDRLVDIVKERGLFSDVRRATANSRNTIEVVCRITEHRNTLLVVSTTIACEFVDKESGNERARATFRGESLQGQPSREASIEGLAYAFAAYVQDVTGR